MSDRKNDYPLMAQRKKVKESYLISMAYWNKITWNRILLFTGGTEQ